MNIAKLPDDILEALKECGYTPNQIAAMTPLQAFHEYCNWHGLLGWGGSLWGIMEDLKSAEGTP